MNNKVKNSTSQIDKRHIGMIGEEIVTRHLLTKSFTIVDRNFLIRGSEVDIVATKNNVLYLCEVKTVRRRRSPEHNPDDDVSRETYPMWQNITKKKIKNMNRSLLEIRKKFTTFHTTVRFFGFIVELDVKHKKAEVITIPDINI